MNRIKTLTVAITVVSLVGMYMVPIANAVDGYSTVPTPGWSGVSGGGVSSILEDAVNRVVYVGGNFTSPRAGLAAYNMDTGALLPFNANLGGLNAYVAAMALSPDRSTLYIGGQFTSPRINLAAIRTSDGTPTSFDAGIPDSPYYYQAVQNLVLTADGSLLYVSGMFSIVNTNVSRNRVAAFDAATGTATAFNPNLVGGCCVSPNTGAAAIALSADESTLYVGGGFTTVNYGQPTEAVRNSLAAFRTSDGVVTSFDPNILHPTYGGVQDLSLSQDGSTIYAAGYFSSANGSIPRNGFASFSTATGVVSNFNPSIAGGYGQGTVIVAPTATSPNVFIAGTFTYVNGVNRVNFAEVDPLSGVPSSYNLSAGGSGYFVGYALLPTAEALYIGGPGLISVGGVPVQGFARMGLASEVPQPTLTLTGSQTSVGVSTVTWSTTNATTCTASAGDAGWSGSRPTAGSYSTQPLSATTTYSMTCTGPGGVVTKSVTLLPNITQCSLDALAAIGKTPADFPPSALNGLENACKGNNSAKETTIPQNGTSNGSIRIDLGDVLVVGNGATTNGTSMDVVDGDNTSVLIIGSNVTMHGSVKGVGIVVVAGTGSTITGSLTGIGTLYYLPGTSLNVGGQVSAGSTVYLP